MLYYNIFYNPGFILSNEHVKYTSATNLLDSATTRQNFLRGKLFLIFIISFKGKLAGFGIEEQLPTIVVVAHYDAFGVAPVSIFGTLSSLEGRTKEFYFN